jgi:hypothetical protein
MNDSKHGFYKIIISDLSTTVYAGDKKIFYLIYTVGQSGLKPGDILKLEIPLLYTEPTVGWDRPAPDKALVSWFSNRDVELTEEVFRKRYVLFTSNSGFLSENDIVVIVYGDQVGGFKGARVPEAIVEADLRLDLAIKKLEDEAFNKIVCSDKIPVLPGPLFQIRPVLKFAKKEMKIKCRLTALDRAGNHIKNYSDNVTYSFIKDDKTVKKGNIRISNGNGEAVIRVDHADNCLISTSVKHGEKSYLSNFLKLTNNRASLNVYWGDLHVHSTLSDGAGSPDFCYSYARDVSGLDFISLADEDGVYMHPWYDNEYFLDYQKSFQIADQYYKEGSFVTFYCYEWMGYPYGHRHIIGKEKFPFCCHTALKHSKPDQLYSLLENKNVIIINHSTTSDFMGTKWQYYDNHFDRLAEIYSMHGSSERILNNSKNVLNSEHQFEGAIIRALAKKFKFGFVGGGDTHISMAGNNLSLTGPYPSLRYKPGLTAVMCETLTRESLFDALFNRQCYATTGERIIIDFRINGYLMGEEVEVKAETEIEISFEVTGTARLKNISVIKNNCMIFKKKNTDVHYEKRLINLIESDFNYFYLKILQVDGNEAWSSPIWVSVKQ